ncbi:hypothetical protein KSF78_0000595 [Schistosoma japonicum]|nr:hypothetical protein KSF78_0000595 [Schistosoma japonicum]
MEFCHWQDDPRNDKAYWRREHMSGDLNNGIICLQPKNFRSYHLGKVHSVQQNSLTARLWSETIEPVSTPFENTDYLGYSSDNPQKILRCLQFHYKIQLHNLDVDSSTNYFSGHVFYDPDNFIKCLSFQFMINAKDIVETKLTLMKHSSEIGLVLLGSYQLRFRNLLNFTGVITRRLDIRYLNNPLNCSFEENNFCGWNDDPRDVLAWWQITHLSEYHTHAACLYLSTRSLIIESGDKLNLEGSARLWSGQIHSNSIDKMQCLGFKYIVLFNKHLPNVRLTLMKHSTGCLVYDWTFNSTFIVALLIQPSFRHLRNPLNCTYDDGTLCGWNMDPRDVLALWQVVDIPSYKTKAMCLLPNPDLSSYRDASGVKHTTDISARLWSGHVRVSKHQLQCLQFSYFMTFKLALKGRLTVMKHSDGACSQQAEHVDKSLVVQSQNCKSELLWQSVIDKSKTAWKMVYVDISKSSLKGFSSKDYKVWNFILYSFVIG